MSLGKLFLTCGITTPPSSRFKMRVSQCFEMLGTTFITVSHPRRPESSSPWKEPIFILSNLCTGCPKNESEASVHAVLLFGVHHNSLLWERPKNVIPRLQQKPTVCYRVLTTALQNLQMGVFSVWYKLEQSEVLKVVLLKIQLFGLLNHCSASSCWWSERSQCFHLQGEAVQ